MSRYPRQSLPKKVYFIKPIGMDGPIKIGCSAAPDTRRSTLETWSPFPLEIIAEIEGGEQLERRFHAKFTAQHKSREWFSVSADLLVTIEAINAGTFEIETLPAPRRLHHGHRTGPKKGTPWTEERKAQARRQRKFQEAKRVTGLVPPFSADAELREKYLADPFSHGVTPEEWVRQRDEQWAKWQQKALTTPTPQRAA